MTLAERVYDCSACGLVIDRDVNAAVNLARWTPASKPRRYQRPPDARTASAPG